MEKIITASGTEFDTDYVATIPMPQMAFIRILNSNLTEIATVFGDPEETKEITYEENTLTGYRFQGVGVEGNAFKVTLVKQGGVTHERNH